MKFQIITDPAMKGAHRRGPQGRLFTDITVIFWNKIQ